MNIDRHLEVLTSATEQIISVEGLKKKLEKNRPLRIKLGFDPSSPDLHIGHALVLDKIAQFQHFGHTAVIIIGDYTARIGDPTGRSKTRVPLDPEQIKANAKTYTDQVFKILDPSKTEIRFNGEWFDHFRYADVLKLNSQISVAQLLEREDFKKRYTTGQTITLTEFQYPLMQGHDSVMVQADVELGGNDQLFNNLVGRDLQKSAGQDPQVVMVMPILFGTDGEDKMSKSLGNSIGLTESPTEMFGKTMSISDATMQQWRSMLGKAYGLPDLAPDHPMEAKKELAQAIIRRFHGEAAAQQARADFEAKFSKRDLAAADIQEITIAKNPIPILNLLQEIGAAHSGSEARRLIQNGAVSLDGEKITDIKAQLDFSTQKTIKCGKRFFAKIHYQIPTCSVSQK